MIAALFTTIGDLGPLPWACPCGATRDMPTIGNWAAADATWYGEHRDHGALAAVGDDVQPITSEIPGQLDMFGGAA